MNTLIRRALIREAAYLVGDASETNPEYRRGIVELIANITFGAEPDELDDPDNARHNVEADLDAALKDGAYAA